jgi:hypothetical protein
MISKLPVWRGSRRMNMTDGKLGLRSEEEIGSNVINICAEAEEGGVGVRINTNVWYGK